MFHPVAPTSMRTVSTWSVNYSLSSTAADLVVAILIFTRLMISVGF